MGSWTFYNSNVPQASHIVTTEKIVSSEDRALQSMVKKVSSSVVSVATKSVSANPYYGGGVSEGAGTGMIISKDGYILTNKHVVNGVSSVSIVTNDGKVYDDVKVVGQDPLNDIAFLKVTTKDSLTPVTFADSRQVKAGEKVFAIGNALGEYQNSVTTGIISGIGRPVTASDGQTDEQLDNLLQTDAAINPGNSGGPLFNLSGEVVGMNTAVAQNAQGIGFAIPSNATKGLLKHLLASGKVERAYLGVRYVSLNASVAKAYNISTTQGAYVFDDQAASAVLGGSPADKAGIKDKDIILKVNDDAVTAANGLALLLAQYAPGDQVVLTVQTGTSTRQVNVTLGAYKN